MTKVILIDDEPNNTAYVNELLKKYFPQVAVVASCNDATEGMLLIDELQPQLIFLDVEMPGLSGFDVLKKLEPTDFEVIFVTAYNHYAIQAFDIHATGYLTKPVNVEKFIKITSAALYKIEKDEINRHIFSMVEMQKEQALYHKIALPTQNGLLFINPRDIMYCQSSGNYTRFITKEGKNILVSRQLGEFEKLFPPDDFHRIHDQYIVGLQYIKEYIRGRGGELVMENGDTLPVSVSRKEGFILRFGKWLRKV